ncbi:MAG: hypothetical protein IKU68_05145, partial [Oscillospiraceae bacterium]|nr:hypothetical protein [Oscillospiraceae bacterium]
YFLVSEQESNQRNRLKAALSRLLPQSKPSALRIHPARTWHPRSTLTTKGRKTYGLAVGGG